MCRAFLGGCAEILVFGEIFTSAIKKYLAIKIYLARQQASIAPANWKTATTARDAARAGTVPARRTEKHPDSI